jgi:hypothetical protein
MRPDDGAARTTPSDVPVFGMLMRPPAPAARLLNGIGKHIAHRLVYDGDTVRDVPSKPSPQVRVFATGNGRKTDPVDALGGDGRPAGPRPGPG